MTIGMLDDLPPPAAPIEPVPDWRQVEADIGTPLPSDYKAFIDTYGSGRIASFLWVFNPASTRNTINLIAQAKARREVLDALRGAEQDIPPSFPEASGLLAFGMTDNGDVLHWRTAGGPGDWPIVVQDSRAPDFAEHDGGVTDFLRDILSGKIACPIFPKDFPPADIGFEPM